MTGTIRFFTPASTDFAPLRAMAREAFAHLYEPAPFLHFLEQAYGPGGTMERDLGDAAIRWLVAASDDGIVDNAKLSTLKRQRRHHVRFPCSESEESGAVAADEDGRMRLLDRKRSSDGGTRPRASRL